MVRDSIFFKALTNIPLRAICLCGFRGTLEKRSRNAAPLDLVATRQDVPLDPTVEGSEGVLYKWWYEYAYKSVPRALLYTSWQAPHRVFLYNTIT